MRGENLRTSARAELAALANGEASAAAMESNDFDGAMRQKERVRAPRRRQAQENEDEESVSRTSQAPPRPGTTLTVYALLCGGRVCL